MIIPLLKKITLAFITSLLLSGLLQSDILLVPSQYSTIQDAIDACTSGQDTIIVSSGTYEENLDFFAKDVILISSSGADSTIIEGDGSGPVVYYSSNGSYSKIEGFTITNGTGQYVAGYDMYLGGGIYCEDSSPTIKSNIIEYNSADYGAGICCDDGGNPTITRNDIKDNTIYGTGDKFGAGICFYYVQGTIKNNTISNNNFDDEDTGEGGGIFVQASTGQQVTIQDNTIVNNSSVKGGGIYTTLGNSISIFENSISSNNAEEGGGVFLNIRTSGSDTVDSNLIFNNRAETSNYDGKGGGIYVAHDAVIRNNMIFDNKANYDSGTQRSGKGGGIYIDDEEPDITNNTLTRNEANEGGGIYYNSTSGTSAIISNTILWNDIAWSSANAEIFHFGAGTLTVQYCDVKGGWSGSTNFNLDPRFCNPTRNNFKISPSWSTNPSPCIGSGLNTAPSIPPNWDFEHEARITGPIVDVGADEAIGSQPL